jgi:hypothetical protein
MVFADTWETTHLADLDIPEEWYSIGSPHDASPSFIEPKDGIRVWILATKCSDDELAGDQETYLDGPLQRFWITHEAWGEDVSLHIVTTNDFEEVKRIMTGYDGLQQHLANLAHAAKFSESAPAGVMLIQEKGLTGDERSNVYTEMMWALELYRRAGSVLNPDEMEELYSNIEDYFINPHDHERNVLVALLSSAKLAKFFIDQEGEVDATWKNLMKYRESWLPESRKMAEANRYFSKGEGK